MNTNVYELLRTNIQDLQKKFTGTQDDTRALINQFKFDQSTVNAMIDQLHVQTNSVVQDKELVKYRIFVKDYQENEIYIGAQQDHPYLFGQCWDNQIINNEEDSSTIYCDRASMTASILLPTGFSILEDTISFKFYDTDESGRSKSPQLYTMLNIVGFAELNEGEPLVIHVIHSFKDQINESEKKDSLQMLKNLLMDTFSGDQLATDWTILMLLSSVSYREANEVSGRILFNLYNISKNDAPQITTALSKVYQPSLLITLTLQWLGQSRLQPKRNMETNLMEHGPLALPTNISSLMIINETTLETGALNEIALQNVQYLQSVIEQSMISVDFTYSKVRLNAELLAFIVSDGRSFIFHNVELPLIPDKTYQNTIPEVNYDQILEFIQTKQTQSQGTIIPDKLRDKISETYAEMRKQNNEVNPQTLILLISMMKIFSALDNHLEVQDEHLQKSVLLWQVTQKRIHDFKSKLI